MTRQDIYDWMDKQIQAYELQRLVPNEDDEFYICCAGANRDKGIHVYGIDHLCEELDVGYFTRFWDGKFDEHYIVYKDYTFFGLVEKEK